MSKIFQTEKRSCRNIKSDYERFEGRIDEEGNSPGFRFGSRCGPVVQWWLGQGRWREIKLGSWPLTGPTQARPWGHKLETN